MGYVTKKERAQLNLEEMPDPDEKKRILRDIAYHGTHEGFDWYLKPDRIKGRLVECCTFCNQIVRSYF